MVAAWMLIMQSLLGTKICKDNPWQGPDARQHGVSNRATWKQSLLGHLLGADCRSSR